MMKKYLLLPALCVMLTPAFTQAYAAGYNVSITMNDTGDIEYNSDYTEAGDCDMYIAVHDSGGKLIGVRKNSKSGTIDADAGKTYSAAAYFWEKGGMTPAHAPFVVKNLKLDSIYVTAAKQTEPRNSEVRAANGGIIGPGGEVTEFSETRVPIDADADSAAKSVYKYLDAVGRSGGILFGHENDINHKAGSGELSDSDVYDVTGDYPALFGIDALSLTGAEYDAGRCNSRYGTKFERTPAGNVKAAAHLTNKAIESGAIVTMSAHMPNFSLVKSKDGDNGESYAKYDFGGYTPDKTTGDVANKLLDGEEYNEMFKAYLDMVADYARQVNGAVLFRPFHENTGSWFWWGADFCTPDRYKEIYRYTVDYLKNTQNVHNILYVYSPGTEFTSADDYETRYPGDEYVDIVGFDCYSYRPDGGRNSENLRKTLSDKLRILSEFAAGHDKVCALTETGVSNPTAAGDSQTALLKSGNPEPDWYINTLDTIAEYPVAYFMVWANFGETSGFYTPYVKKVKSSGTLFGHEMMDNFIDFYNDSRSIFASDQKEIISDIQ